MRAHGPAVYGRPVFGRNWEPATARIIAKKYGRSDDAAGTWTYVADISPGSAPPFRVRLKQPHFMSHVVWLNEGDVVGALADVRHQKAKFDRSDPKVSGKSRRRPKDRVDEALQQPPGSPPPS